MKLERIATNKIKYSISFEELSDKGFVQEELLKNSFIWDDLFEEMLDEANKRYEVETDGAVSIEIFSLTAKELVLILTLDEHDLEEAEEEEEFIPASDGSAELIFQFEEIDPVIMLAKSLRNLPLGAERSTLISLKERYYMLFDCEDRDSGGLAGLCEEFGATSHHSAAYLLEYGKVIIRSRAVDLLAFHF